MYNENSILVTGPYKHKKLKDIPVKYFQNIYKNSSHDVELNKWVKENIHRIVSGNWDLPEPTPIYQEYQDPQICNKLYFCDEKTAKEYLRTRKKKRRQTTGLPVRCYECPKCGAWHLTSIPIDEWKARQETYKRFS